MFIAADALLAYSQRSLDEVRTIAQCMIGDPDRHHLLRVRISDDRVDDWCHALADLPPKADAEQEETANG